MRITTEQARAYAEQLLAVAEKAERGSINYVTGGKVEVVLGSPYVINGTAAGDLPHSGPSASYHNPMEIQFDLSSPPVYSLPTPPITRISEEDMWCEQTVEELNRTREVIIERGWIQGALMSTEGVCTIGAMTVAQSGLTRHRDRARALVWVLERFLVEQEQVSYESLARWNDDDSRTRDEVLDVLHRCALWVKEKISNG